jgi:hypothetical protein
MTLSANLRSPDAVHDDWCIDDETRHAIVARRNVLAALWAGRLLGKHGEELECYAREVHRSDFEMPGDADIVAKLSRDLAAAGFNEEARAVRMHLARFQKQAWRDSVVTD